MLTNPPDGELGLGVGGLKSQVILKEYEKYIFRGQRLKSGKVDK